MSLSKRRGDLDELGHHHAVSSALDAITAGKAGATPALTRNRVQAGTLVPVGEPEHLRVRE
ncbi:hypothetical protein [Flexivirga sp. B27]